MKENKEFENLKNISEKILEEKDEILEKAEKEHPETKRLENLVNEKIEQTRNEREERGKEKYKYAIGEKREIDHYRKNPKALDEYVRYTDSKTLNFLRGKDEEEKLLELKEARLAWLSDKTPESYLKRHKEDLDRLKQELNNLPSMDLEIFKNKIYDKSPEKIEPLVDDRGKPSPGGYRHAWYNAIFDDQKLLSWKQLPLELSRKLFFYVGYPSKLEGYKESNERDIEGIETELNGFLKAAIENKDIETVVDTAILLKKLDSPEITSFVKEQMEELQKSPEKADKEKLISISEKISQIEK